MADETYAATSGAAGAAGVWTAIVTIAGVDRSSIVVGEIRIEADESSARIAELTVRPPAASVFSVPDWVGKSISIDIANNASGTPADIRRLFSGLIDTPALDFDLKTIHLRCTDNLQAVIDALDNAAIDALTPGASFSPAIFDAAAIGWGRLQDRLSTLPAAVDLDLSGAPRLTAWAAKVSADIAFTDAHLLDGSLSVSLSSRHQLVNRVVITFAYRFPRVKADRYGIAYDYVSDATISQHVIDGNRFLRRDTCDAAIKAAGGTIESITYTPLPNVPVIGSWVQGPDDYQLCMGFSASVSFDFAQQIQETHTITVSTPGSIAAVGTLAERISGAMEGVYPQIQTAEQSILLYSNAISGIPPMDSATPVQGFTTAANVTLTAETDRTAANSAMTTLIDVAKTRIHGAHRRNSVSGRVPLNPALDLDKTVSVAAAGVAAKGKCVRVVHTLSPQSGEAVSDFSIAICSVAGTGVSHPETPTTAPTGSLPATTPLLGTPTAVFNDGPSEDHKLIVTFPGVEAVERNLAQIALSASYDATIPEDPLTITL